MAAGIASRYKPGRSKPLTSAATQRLRLQFRQGHDAHEPNARLGFVSSGVIMRWLIMLCRSTAVSAFMRTISTMPRGNRATAPVTSKAPTIMASRDGDFNGTGWESQILPWRPQTPPAQSQLDATTLPLDEELLWTPPPGRQKKRKLTRRLVFEADADDVNADVLDEQCRRVVSLVTNDGHPAVQQFTPRSTWLYKRWRGTVLQTTWPKAFIVMVFGSIFITLVRSWSCMLPGCNLDAWSLFTTPPPSHPVIARLLPLNAFWHIQLTLTTFIVTFFLQKAYDFWRISYKLSRSIQGRLQNINLMLATHCFRDGSGGYTRDSRTLLEDTARNIRLLHALFWAGIDDSLSAS